MKAIITGGTGFVGKYVVKELLNKNNQITLLTSDKTFKYDNPCVRIVHTNYTYNDLMEKISEIGSQDIFYHLGWAGVGGKEKNNISLQTSNIQCSIDMILYSKKLGCSVFVAAGTVAEYVFNKDVIDFSKKQTPNDVYGATKVATHYMLEAVAREIKQNLIWAVLPSTFGEGRKEDNIISYTVVKLLRGEKPLYGNLEQMWDFLYVTEVARALVLIGEKGTPNTTYGIGSGEYRLLKEYICVIRDMIIVFINGDVEREENNMKKT